MKFLPKRMLIILLIVYFSVSLLASKTFYLDPRHVTTFNSEFSCPPGYGLAILDDPEDWKAASELALKVLGYNKSAWIRFGQGWRGIGNERWSLITPKPPNSCQFPPKDLKSFCVPVDRFRLSPETNSKAPKKPSICEKIA